MQYLRKSKIIFCSSIIAAVGATPWFGLVWLYAASTTVTHGVSTGDTLPDPTKNNTTINHQPKNCTEAEKIYYGTYKFAVCEKNLYWCWYHKKDPGKKAEVAANCSTSSGYSTSCEYIRFLVQVCGTHYKVCHIELERKPIIKMWIKQVFREIVEWSLAWGDVGLELKKGKCNDILEEYFDKEEINEISGMINTRGVNAYTNVTIEPIGVLANDNGTGKMPIPETSQIYQYFDRLRIEKYGLTLPSHWKYCDWKITPKFQSRHDKAGRRHLTEVMFQSFLLRHLPDLFHCDGECNTNEGDDQVWYEPKGIFVGAYQDLNERKIKYMKNLTTATSEIIDCYKGYLNSSKYDDCERYQRVIKYCPIRRCLGNIAIREVVINAIVRNFKPETCWEKASKKISNANYLVSSFMFNILCFLFQRAI